MYKKGVIDVLLHPIHIFVYCCHMVIVLNDYISHSCWGLHLDFRVLQIGGPKLMGALAFSSLHCGLSYYALVFVCLMQSLS